MNCLFLYPFQGTVEADTKKAIEFTWLPPAGFDVSNVHFWIHLFYIYSLFATFVTEEKEKENCDISF